ncbi:MAG: hypothetical protein H0U49_00100 [Parachlamydiaceae bacterium]|nr:hypothetical protein [Parachlamydiaceae bacterium]
MLIIPLANASGYMPPPHSRLRQSHWLTPVATCRRRIRGLEQSHWLTPVATCCRRIRGLEQNLASSPLKSPKVETENTEREGQKTIRANANNLYL